jgi:hypothetical protein
MARPVSRIGLLEQRAQALGRANEIRIGRAQVKRDLHQGRVEISQLLAAPPASIESAPLLEILLAVPKLGPVKTTRLLRQAGISEAKTVGGLTDRQRARLLELLRLGNLA